MDGSYYDHRQNHTQTAFLTSWCVFGLGKMLMLLDYWWLFLTLDYFIKSDICQNLLHVIVKKTNMMPELLVALLMLVLQIKCWWVELASFVLPLTWSQYSKCYTIHLLLCTSILSGGDLSLKWTKMRCELT